MLNPYYYEAILQLRPAKKELIDFVIKRVSERKDVFISRTVELKTGIDFYLSSWRFAIALGKMLKKSFGGSTKLSRTLFAKSRQTSKKVYRVTVLFRL